RAGGSHTRDQTPSQIRTDSRPLPNSTRLRVAPVYTLPALYRSGGTMACACAASLSVAVMVEKATRWPRYRSRPSSRSISCLTRLSSSSTDRAPSPSTDCSENGTLDLLSCSTVNGVHEGFVQDDREVTS